MESNFYVQWPNSIPVFEQPVPAARRDGMKPGFLASLADALQRFDRRMWPAHRISLPPKFREILCSSKVIIADVGAAAGPEDRWHALEGLVHFLTFEPRSADAAPSQDDRRTNFPIGLGSRQGRASLTLMRDPDASTLCEINDAALESYPIRDGLEPVGKAEIVLDTLDHCLETRPQLSPDFLKIDVEGTDLDVLRGAVGALNTTVLGVRIEVSFVERHRGAAFYGETDAFLREHCFQLFQLSRERWIRNNLVYGLNSEPQLAWGDAVYFLSLEAFLERLRQRAEAEREGLTAKFLAVLLAHDAHDYAMEIAERCVAEKMVSPDWGQQLARAVLDSLENSLLFAAWSLAGMLFASGVYVLAFPLKSTRQRAKFYVQQRVGHFSRMLARMAGRHGPEKSCVSD